MTFQQTTACKQLPNFKFTDHLTRQAGPLVNYDKSNKHYISVSYDTKIDRIQISVKSGHDNRQRMKTLLSETFGIGKPQKPRKKKKLSKRPIVIGYRHNGKLVQLINYRNYPFYFAVNIHDPDDELQSLVRDMIISLHDNKYELFAYIKAIEFAYDLTPNDISKLELLKDQITNTIYLRNSRKDSFKQYKNTHYQGKKGNVHNGSIGLRCYIKTVGSAKFLRIELQANARIIKEKFMFNILSLPVNTSMIDYSKFIEFRKGRDQQGMMELAKNVYETYKKNNKHKQVKSKYKPISDFLIPHFIVRTISGYNKNLWFFDYVLPPIPVAQQISGYKKLFNKFRPSYKHGHYFPKINVLNLNTDGRGFINNDHTQIDH